LIKPI